jgi:hypothetical protein
VITDDRAEEIHEWLQDNDIDGECAPELLQALVNPEIPGRFRISEQGERTIIEGIEGPLVLNGEEEVDALMDRLLELIQEP